MSGSLGRIRPHRRSGDEYLHSAGELIHPDANLQNFWEWYGSDILSNTERGVFAEYIVAHAVGDESVMTDAREGWESYDLLSSDGTKVEVKSSAYIQSWRQMSESNPIFDIARKLAWDANTDTFSDEQVRSSDIYVFCLYNRRASVSPNTLNPLDVAQWDFFILPTSVLDRKVPKQKTISLGGLDSLGARKVSFEQIHDTIREMLAETKCTDAT